jgi:subfamily B ATP-binding cassette protein MsbA
MKFNFLVSLTKILLIGFEKNSRKCFSSFAAIFLVNFFVALLEGISFAFIMLAFSALTDLVSLKNSFVFSNFYIKEAASEFSPNTLFSIFIIAAVCIQFLRSGFNYLGQLLCSKISNSVLCCLQRKIYQNIMSFSFPFLSGFKTGDLTEYIKSPITALPGLFQYIHQFLVSLMTCLVSIFLMFAISFKLTLITLFLFIVLGSFQRILMKKIRSTSESYSENLVELSKLVTQAFQGIRAIFTFDRQKKSLNEAVKVLDRMAYSSNKLHAWHNAVPAINESMGILLVGVCCFLGPDLLGGDQISVTSLLITFVTVTYRMASKIQMLASSVGNINYLWGHISRINEIMRLDDKEYARNNGLQIAGINKAVTFESVFLKYPSRGVFAVNDVSLNIEKGTTKAFVGSSGAGKSSLIDLLIGLYEPTKGCIKIDGINLNDICLSSWRQKLGVVSQDSFILNDTIEENIRFGFENCSKDEMVAIAKKAGAHDFITALPEGYQTIVGDRGYRLSGGERQRIALARALIRNPQVLILDEATSNLDSKSESIIQDCLENFQSKITIIMIAHRLSTVVDADEIFVMDLGRIIERGKHYDLLQFNGAYADLWKIQTTAKECKKNETLNLEDRVLLGV